MTTTTHKPERAVVSAMEQTVNGYRRILTTIPGYNDRNGTYGVHGLDLELAVVKDGRAVSVSFSTGWVPGEKGVNPRLADCYPSGRVLGWHWPEPTFGADTPSRDGACAYLDGQCYWDGSFVAADDLLVKLVDGGLDAVWAELERLHADATTGHEEDADAP